MSALHLGDREEYPVPAAYAVVWREADGPVLAGKLELGVDGLSLKGSGPRGLLARRRLDYADLTEIRIGREPSERLNSLTSVILERHAAPPIFVAALESPGTVFELGDVLAELASERASKASCVTVVVPIKRGAQERALRLIEAGPPFDPTELSLERHRVFVTEREVVFLFEGEDARRAVEKLARRPSVWRVAAAWRDCLAGAPRVAVEAYSWAGSSSALR